MIRQSRNDAVSADHRMKELGHILVIAEQYHDNLPYKRKYKKAKDPEKYFRCHESEVALCNGAEQMLKNAGINPADINLEELRKEYESLKQEKAVSLEKAKLLSDDIKELEHCRQVMYDYEKEDERRNQQVFRNRDQTL